MHSFIQTKMALPVSVTSFPSGRRCGWSVHELRKGRTQPTDADTHSKLSRGYHRFLRVSVFLPMLSTRPVLWIQVERNSERSPYSGAWCSLWADRFGQDCALSFYAWKIGPESPGDQGRLLHDQHSGDAAGHSRRDTEGRPEHGRRCPVPRMRPAAPGAAVPQGELSWGIHECGSRFLYVFQIILNEGSKMT